MQANFYGPGMSIHSAMTVPQTVPHRKPMMRLCNQPALIGYMLDDVPILYVRSKACAERAKLVFSGEIIVPTNYSEKPVPSKHWFYFMVHGRTVGIKGRSKADAIKSLEKKYPLDKYPFPHRWFIFSKPVQE